MKRLFYVVGLMYGFQTITNAATDCNQVTQIPVSECQALLDIYNANPNSNLLSLGWNTNNTPCNWIGIYCAGTNHINELTLQNSSLQGQFPDINLPHLTRLKLHGNKLTSVSNFSNPLLFLSELRLDDNQLTSVPNFQLPNLLDLSISGNQLSSIPNFSNLSNLRWLIISNNKLTSIPNFSNVPTLTLLDASGNQLTGNIPDLNLPNLGTLNLFNNQLSGNIPDFSHLPSLGELNLSNNQLTGCIPNNLPGYLNLSKNQLTGNIPNMKGLSSDIYLSNNQLSGKIPAFFSNLKDTYSGEFGTFPIVYSEDSFRGGLFSKNCGLIAYDEAQETLLNKIEPKWKIPNPHCSNPNTTCPLVDISLYNLAIHLPHVNYNGMTLSANLRYAPRDGKMLFEVADYSFASNDCSSANLSPNFKLHIPAATLGNLKLWLNLQPYLASDGQIVFELISFGHV